MSHGGGAGGGGGCHGGHGGHHGGHGAAMGMHADQSPGWNMAMQAERTEVELGKRLTIADPRIVIGLTLFVFVTLLSLPYTLDYLQSQGLEPPGEPGPGEESNGPSAAALSMVGTTLMGGHVELPESAMERLSGAHNDNAARKKQILEDQHTQAQHGPDLPSLEQQQQAALESARKAIDEAPAVAEQSANETVDKMVEASGMSGTAAASPAVANVPTLPAMAPAPASFGTPLQQPQNPPPVMPQAPGLTMIEYGGAVRGPNQQYYVYIPNQNHMQANANYGQPVSMMPAQMPQQYQAQQQIASQHPRQLAMAMPMQQSSTVAQRSAFNPDTSAITAPLGTRNRAASPSMPMLPSGLGQDGSQRLRVWASR